jgi:Spy/CpxP family protein refolding chaperone
MRIGYLMLYFCLIGVVLSCGSFGQDQKQDNKSDRETRWKQYENGSRGEKKFFRESGEGGWQGAILGKIVNNPEKASEIGLTEEQIKILKDSMEETKKQQEVFQKQLKESGIEQAKMMTKDTIDENALFEAVEKAGKIRTEIAKIHIKQMLVVKKTLKPDQIEKIKEMVQKKVKQIRGETELRGQKGKNSPEAAKDNREKPRKHQEEEKKEKTVKPSGEV